MSLHVRTVLTGRACVRIFFAASGNALEQRAAKFAAKNEHGIDKNGTWRFASRAAFHSINDPIAQDWGQSPVFEGKSCSHGRLFTRRESALPLLGAFGRMISHEDPVFTAERNMSPCQHPRASTHPRFGCSSFSGRRYGASSGLLWTTRLCEPLPRRGVCHYRTGWDRFA